MKDYEKPPLSPACVPHVILQTILLVFCLTSGYRVCRAGEGVNPDATIRVDTIDTSHFPEIRTIVSIKDKNGQPVKGLGISNFHVANSNNVQEFVQPKSAISIIESKEEPILYLTILVNQHKSIEKYREQICAGVKNTFSHPRFNMALSLIGSESAPSAFTFASDAALSCKSLQSLQMSNTSAFYNALIRSK